jgi:small subunit ribosomal protein S4
VNHGHFQVNGKKVDIPSYQVRPGDVVTIKDKSKDAIVIQHAVDTQGREAPAWLRVDLGERKVDVADRPRRDQIDTAINEQLIVELYSK